MKKLVRLDKQTDNKYLNLYKATFLDGDRQMGYYIASRRNAGDLTCEGSSRVDGVRIIPYYYDGDKCNVVLIKEYRYPVGNYIFATPAGLIDEGEEPKDAVVRELMEETGYKVISLKQTSGASYSSAGMSDERLICFEAEVALDGKQNLGDREDIEVVVVSLDDLETFIDSHQFGLQSELQLKAFIYKRKYEDLKNK